MNDRDSLRQHEKELVGLCREARRGGITRRQFVERALILGLSAGAVGALAGACGESEEEGGGAQAVEMPPMDETKPDEITVYNWTDYMDPDVRKDFRKETGIKANETYFANNEELLAKLRAGASGWDVIIPSDYMVSILIKSELLQPLDLSYIPSFEFINAEFRAPAYDDPADNDGMKYSVPYFYGTTGYAVRIDKAPGTYTRWDTLFDPANNGKIIMLDDERECLGASLKSLGFSGNTTDQAELDQATDKLIQQKPIVAAYDSLNRKRSIVQGIPFVMCWDFDALLAIDTMGGDDEAWETVDYVLPEEGFMRWTDNMCVPTSAEKRYGAHLFIDYVTRPEVSGKNASWIWCASPVDGSEEYTDEFALAVRSTDEELARSEPFLDLGEFAPMYQEAWTQIRTA
ncbi:MAG: spermidine/putrescine ABC transporter substrate-binding protein [Thermoleophilia bacterium]|nr:spermidine/putrescine ABC transporter substrate-binding protein [Thermoleophilia bacterium]